LFLTEGVWATTVSLLAPYAASRVESGLYWYGLRGAEAASALVVGIPRQTNRRGDFEVTETDLAELVRTVPEPLVAVAQLHTHPGFEIEHSPWDDEMAISQKVLSLVIADYGRSPRLPDVAVHEHRATQWDRLSVTDAKSRIVVVTSPLDTRS
jgi:hypothetical protein